MSLRITDIEAVEGFRDIIGPSTHGFSIGAIVVICNYAAEGKASVLVAQSEGCNPLFTLYYDFREKILLTHTGGGKYRRYKGDGDDWVNPSKANRALGFVSWLMSEYKIPWRQ